MTEADKIPKRADFDFAEQGGPGASPRGVEPINRLACDEEYTAAGPGTGANPAAPGIAPEAKLQLKDYAVDVDESADDDEAAVQIEAASKRRPPPRSTVLLHSQALSPSRIDRATQPPPFALSSPQPGGRRGRTLTWE